MNNEEVTELLARVGRGHEDAFTALYKVYSSRVKAFVLRRLSATTQSAADDIVSETFVALWRSAKAFDNRSRFSTWLLGIANNKILEWHRKNGRLGTMENIEDVLEEADESVDADVFRWVARKEMAGAIDICLEKLSAVQRTTLYLTHVEGMSQGEVAEVMSVSQNTVKSRLRLAIHGTLRCLARDMGIKSDAVRNVVGDKR
jgi:RNA polymerase sigma-70 factor (ECF subfamily)